VIVQMTISIGDIFVIAGLLGSVAYNYAIVRTTLGTIEKQIYDMRRGRGLILGPDSDWPPQVRRCFGFGPNGHAARDDG
jgi:hypothetical protein